MLGTTLMNTARLPRTASMLGTALTPPDSGRNRVSGERVQIANAWGRILLRFSPVTGMAGLSPVTVQHDCIWEAPVVKCQLVRARETALVGL